MKPEFSLQIFEKYPDIVFHENAPIGNCGFVQCGSRDGRVDGRTDGRTDRRRDMTNLIFAFPNFATAPHVVVTKREVY